MITTCTECRQQIRDCTDSEQRGFIRVPVRGWYHTATGYTECAGGGTMAKPAPLVSVRCPLHRRKADEGCTICYTSAQVSLYFHNLGRCIPRLCGWTHAQ